VSWRQLSAAVAGCAALVFATPGAWADTDGTTTLTISVAPPAVRSITTSVAAASPDFCTDDAVGLTGTTMMLPHGLCMIGDSSRRSLIGVTYGGDSNGTVLVQSTNVLPADNGQAWQLCDSQQPGEPTATVECANSSTNPGADQAFLELQSEDSVPDTGFLQQNLVNTPRCETPITTGTFAPCTQRSAGSTRLESLAITGPQSSTDTAASFHFSVTWTAAP
jgi:hypothetical protein